MLYISEFLVLPILRSKILEALMQFRNIYEANAQKLLLYQNLCCSENCRIGFDTICFVKRLEMICEQ